MTFEPITMPLTRTKWPEGIPRNLEQLINSVSPHNIEAEELFLGCLLQFPRIADRALGLLEPDDFYGIESRLIYQAIQAVHSRGVLIDVVTVEDELGAKLSEINGGRYKLSVLCEIAISGENAFHQAKVIRELALKRRIAALACGLLKDVQKGAKVDSVLTKVAEQLETLEAAQVGVKDRSISGAMDELAAEKADIAKGNTPRNTPTGLSSLDELALFRPGNLIILAGQTGGGKTSLAVTIINNVAHCAKQPVLMFSLEMSRLEIAERLLSIESGIPSDELQSKDGVKQHAVGMTKSMSKFKNAAVIEVDSDATTIAQLERESRKFIAKHPDTGLIVVDYLQLLSAGNPKLSIRENLVIITRRLKLLAQKLGVPIIALSQLSRNAAERPDGRPVVTDLKESGSIENDANSVWLLYTPPKAAPGEMVLFVAKNRSGPRREIKLRFDRKQTRFREPIPDGSF